jgi:hypothetical protein
MITIIVKQYKLIAESAKCKRESYTTCAIVSCFNQRGSFKLVSKKASN